MCVCLSGCVSVCVYIFVVCIFIIVYCRAAVTPSTSFLTTFIRKIVPNLSAHNSVIKLFVKRLDFGLVRSVRCCHQNSFEKIENTKKTRRRFDHFVFIICFVFRRDYSHSPFRPVRPFRPMRIGK